MGTEPKAKTCCHLKGRLFKGNVHEVFKSILMWRFLGELNIDKLDNR